MCLHTGAYNLLAINVFFNESMYSVNEDSEHLNLTLALSKPSSTDITLQVTVTAGSTATGELTDGINTGDICVHLTAGDDYTGSGPFYITFPAGHDNVTFMILITNDDVVENTETFTLSINPSSLPSGVTIGDPSQATVTIIDDDSKYSEYVHYSFVCWICNHDLFMKIEHNK